MTDKLKDQDSSAPAATEGKQKALSKTRSVGNVIINPPEKVDPQRGFQERFKAALTKHTVAIEEKTTMVLQVKASRAGLPEDVLEQVYIRGFKSLPLNSDLTREQYAMNRVNSFVAGGAAMQEDFDVLPIYERVGMKGTGGAMRPHIKREKSVYNGRTLYHVVDKKGHVKHTTGDEYAAKKHLAQKYHHYSESTLSPMKRFEGTKSLVKTYKGDTPGEKLKEAHEKKKAKGGFKPLMAKLTPQRGKGSFELKVQEETLSELSTDLLGRYKKKAGEAASAADKKGDYDKGNKRFKGIMKATRKQFDNDMKNEEKVVSGGYRDKTGKWHPPVTASGAHKQGSDNFYKAAQSLAKKYKSDQKQQKEETELQELSKDKLNSYLWSAKSNRDQIDAKASKAMEKNRKEFSTKRHANVTKLLDKSLKRTGNIIKAADKIMAKKD